MPRGGETAPIVAIVLVPLTRPTRYHSMLSEWDETPLVAKHFFLSQLGKLMGVSVAGQETW